MDGLKDYLHTMVSCNHCGQCKWILGPKMRSWRYAEVCPIHARFGFDAYSGQGLINIAQELLEGRLKYEAGLIRLIYTCLTCGACDINCKSIRDMEVLDTILALRAKCVEDGWAPLPEHRELRARIETHHNIFGEPHGQRFAWLPDGAGTSADCGVAYFAGCSSSYRHPEIALNTVRLLTAAGIDFRVLGADEYCCGAPLWRTGQMEAFQTTVEKNLDAFSGQGIRTLITGCAECFGTFRGGYPRFAGLEFEVFHVSEVLLKALLEGRLKTSRRLDLKVTYHDPCLLGRLSEKYVPWNGTIKAFGLHEPPKQWRRGTGGVYEAPREILRSIPGVELSEMDRNQENSFCCGAGGGVPEAFPEFAQWVADERIGEARSTGAEALISCCPFCKDSFEKAITATGSTMRYYDLSELLARAL